MVLGTAGEQFRFLSLALSSNNLSTNKPIVRIIILPGVVAWSAEVCRVVGVIF